MPAIADDTVDARIMQMKRIYLDYAATTPTRLEVVEAMLPYFTESFGNPSSIHRWGQEAKAAIEASRVIIANLVGAQTEEILFTSGGTEADNFAIKGVSYANRHKGNHIITTTIEHHAVLEPCHFLGKQGFAVTCLRVDKHGLVDPDEVRKAITDRTILISVMHANNEVGTIQPIAEIGRIARERGVYFHTDAVQTVGHIPINVDEFGVDLLAMSAHKLYGPKGIGALYVRKGTRIASFMHGGGQERGLRASTENVPAIVGFGKAVEIAQQEMDSEVRRLLTLRDKLTRGLTRRIDRVHLNGHPSQRLPNNVNVSVEFVEGEALLMNLDLRGIAASSGSACTSRDLKASHVLTAMGIPEEVARGSIRFSLGRENAPEDIDYLLKVMPPIVDRLREMSPLYSRFISARTIEGDIAEQK